MIHRQVRKAFVSPPDWRPIRWLTALAGLLATNNAIAALPPGNLLANPSGMQEANFDWTITAGPVSPPNYNTGWRRDGGTGVSPFNPSNVRAGFGGRTTFRDGYFRTSYSNNPCSRFQLIDLEARGATRAELNAQPEIKVGEWISSYSANVGNYSDNFFITVKLLAENGTTELATWTVNNTTNGGIPNTWTLFQNTFANYGEGLRYIRFESGGWDGGNWLGQYGSFHDESFVEFTHDSDGDGLPDAVEAAYGNGADLTPEGDVDGDGLTNLEEYEYGTDIGNPDTDGDGLDDGDEITHRGNALIRDTDGDGIEDGDEVHLYQTMPDFADSDNDGFSDYAEIFGDVPSDPNSATSVPGGITAEKRYELVGSDLTDPENDGNDSTANGTNFNWTAIQAGANGTFANEGTYSVFDNKVNQSGSKWYAATVGTTAWVQVKFDQLTSLTGFSLTSGGDAPERDPLIWEIQGSIEDVATNPTKFTTIYRWTSNQPPWLPSERNVTYSVTLPKKTLPYRWIRYQAYSVRSGTAFQLDEIEYFGEKSNADADGDQIPKLWEDYYAFMSDSNAADATADQDGDGLNNRGEFLAGTDPTNPDTDGDGLTDGQEVNTFHSNPLLTDSDGDGLTDGQEAGPGGYGTDPAKADTDGDGFSDYIEVMAATPTNPLLNTSNPANVTATKPATLVGGDLTDPENNGNDSTPTGTNFNWSHIQASVNGTFLGTSGEGAFSVFDNKVNVAGSKWLLNGFTSPQWIQVKFDTHTSLTGFSLTSGGDFPERDPLVWEIQGSTEDVNANPTKWKTIFRWDYGQPPWTNAERARTYLVTLPKKTLPYRWIRFQVNSLRSGTTFQLDEIEYFGERTNADADGDQIPKLWEDYYAFMSDSNAADALADQDGDGLNNRGEYLAGTDPTVADSDGDGLSDGLEVNTYQTNPLAADTDGDGLTDFQEVGPGGYGTDPKKADTDGDGFSDFAEVNNVPPTDPKSATSAPYRVTILGTGNGSLIGADLTDPEDDINDGLTTTSNAGSGFNWVASYTNSTKNYFNGPANTGTANEGILNLFDNKVGGGEAKYCCEAGPRFITLEFANPVSLTHFTMASGNDSLERSPAMWELAGSNNNTDFTVIVADTTPGHHWTAFDQVLRFDLNQPAPPYKFIKLTLMSSTATAPVTNAIQFSEVEYFGSVVTQTALAIASSRFDSEGDFQVEAKGMVTGTWYQLFRSTTLENNWTPVGAAVQGTTPTHVFEDENPPATKAFYRVGDVLPPP
ncbi:hypothetical protein OKA04_07975 [Luteolibacter flavescens]|uniref:FBA domain-containing protein n=1 Tax=Luteolibacter flavescens TaxID=1859460 RepID=A0ABT3FNV7_9BACT|nr:binary toxin-like calcium binding domain-containing protein [Luteolibacter flavescens]MCW1884665.1 hypothetical protein [Luteolibacter flavescens]